MNATPVLGGSPRCGTVVFAGRPNAGKSTLLNRLLGEKLAIVSSRTQTTRQRMVGVLSGERGQMILWDTPGFHKPMHRLNREMVRIALESILQADVACLVVDATESFGRGDSMLLERFDQRASGSRFLVLNKIDRVRKPDLLPLIQRYSSTSRFDEIVPVSARTGEGCDLLTNLLWERLPEGLPLYDPEILSPHPERFLVAERIREKVLEAVTEELPHASAVVIEHWETDGDLIRIHASLLVERSGQKKIMVGTGGEMIKRIGTAARLDLEKFLGSRVFLDLRVKEEAGWRDDEAVLRDLDRDNLRFDS